MRKKLYATLGATALVATMGACGESIPEPVKTVVALVKPVRQVFRFLKHVTLRIHTSQCCFLTNRILTTSQ